MSMLAEHNHIVKALLWRGRPVPDTWLYEQSREEQNMYASFRQEFAGFL